MVSFSPVKKENKSDMRYFHSYQKDLQNNNMSFILM